MGKRVIDDENRYVFHTKNGGMVYSNRTGRFITPEIIGKEKRKRFSLYLGKNKGNVHFYSDELMELIFPEKSKNNKPALQIVVDFFSR